jgi:hypothetical protein
MSNEPFNMEKAAFFLIAVVIVSQLVVGLSITGACVFYAGEIITGSGQCKADGKMAELMSAALAAALAFAGRGRMEK